jgi:hypothetical protein
MVRIVPEKPFTAKIAKKAAKVAENGELRQES